MKTKVETLLYVVLRGTWLVVGICLGAVAVMMINSGAELALDRSLAWGIAIGVGLCILAAFILIMLRPKELDAPPPLPETAAQETRALMDKLAGKLDLDESESTQLWEVGKQQAKSVAAFGLRLWSGAAALGMAAAVAGSVIAMVTAFAAIRQVSRIDAQNALLEQQIFEARASRAAGVFAAQLPSLLAAIDAERATLFEEQRINFGSLSRALDNLETDVNSQAYKEAVELFNTQLNLSLPDELTPMDVMTIELAMKRLVDRRSQMVDMAEQRLWRPSAALVARIQAVIDTSEPFLRLPEVDRAVEALNAVVARRNQTRGELVRSEDFRSDTERQSRLQKLGWQDLSEPMLFSPQRGQLLRLLIAANIDMSTVDPPFDFSQSDLSGFVISSSSSDATGKLRTVDFGRMDLSKSSFLGASLDNLDLSEANLTGSVLEDTNQVQFAKTVPDRGTEGFSIDPLSRDVTAIFGTLFEDVLVLRQPFGEFAEVFGAIGTQISLDDGTTFQIHEAKELDHQVLPVRPAAPKSSYNSLIDLYEVRNRARVDTGTVYRLGEPELLSRVFDPVSAAFHRVSSDHFTREGCTALNSNALDVVQDIVWYSMQPSTHPKWDTALTVAMSLYDERHRACLLEFDHTIPRTPPELGRAMFFPRLKRSP